MLPFNPSGRPRVRDKKPPDKSAGSPFCGRNNSSGVHHIYGGGSYLLSEELMPGMVMGIRSTTGKEMVSLSAQDVQQYYYDIFTTFYSIQNVATTSYRYCKISCAHKDTHLSHR
ncbi:hypothetical protein AVEN_272787-1 [Araneus ventricosus]|uniref:Uncharacterized protein n=1 Tax=Araneus ventricosus TaxID=182803 RepID=A0A4Y2RTZ6_ARAVE|nr:hypothetical protein AVEN_272787-1 [Araneus ventricosus]